MSNPTQRSLKLMRDRGFYAEVVERYNAFSKVKNDFAGFIDILCLAEGKIIGVQTTSYSNISARRKKILTHDNYSIVKNSGIEIHIHGWRKVNNKWQAKEEIL